MDNKMDKKTLHHKLSEELIQAERSRRPIASLSARHPELSLDDAYQIQWLQTAKAMKEGRRLIGYKVGLTGVEVRKQLKIDQPDFGCLFSDRFVADGSEISLGKLISPKIEGELAFVLAKDLKGPNITIAEAMSAVDYAMVALEIVDSRIENWKISAVDTIADNGSSGYFVLGGQKSSLVNVDLGRLGLVLTRNQEVVSTGSGAAVLDNPMMALVFLANQLAKFGRELLAGQVIMTGAFSGLVPMAPQDIIDCEIHRTGRVRVRCVP